METVETATPSATTGEDPVIIEFVATGVPAVKTTVPPVLTTGVAMARVFVSAVEDLRVQVESPEASEDEQAVMTLVVPVLVAVKVGVLPDTALLFASLRLIVMVEAATPSAETGEEPVMLEFAATAIPAVKTTAPPALTTGVAIDKVLDSALRDLSVQVETPEESEVEQSDMTLVVPVSVAEKVGITPLTLLLPASFKVMVTVDMAVPSARTGEVPIMVELAATAESAVNTTVPPALTTGVAIESVLVSAVIDFRVQVETPEASETEHAVGTLVDPVSVAVKVGV